MASKNKGKSNGNNNNGGSAGGNDRAVNLKNTEVGRARKRAIQQVRRQAVEAKKQAELASHERMEAERRRTVEEQKAELNLLFASASGNPQLLVSGAIGAIIGVPLEKFEEGKMVASGRIVVQVVTDRHGDPAATVIGSDFGPIPVFERGLYLPLRTLRSHKLQQVLPGWLHVLQLELWHALRFACRRELRAETRIEAKRFRPRVIEGGRQDEDQLAA